jgi:hypothetical protein
MIDLNKIFNHEQIREMCLRKFVDSNQKPDPFLDDNTHIAAFLILYSAQVLGIEMTESELLENDKKITEYMSTMMAGAHLDDMVNKGLLDVNFVDGKIMYSATKLGAKLYGKEKPEDSSDVCDNYDHDSDGGAW